MSSPTSRQITRTARTTAPGVVRLLVSVGVLSSAAGCHHVRRSSSTASRPDRFGASLEPTVRGPAFSGSHPVGSAPFDAVGSRCGSELAALTCSSPSSPMYAGSIPSRRSNPCTTAACTV